MSIFDTSDTVVVGTVSKLLMTEKMSVVAREEGNQVVDIVVVGTVSE